MCYMVFSRDVHRLHAKSTARKDSLSSPSMTKCDKVESNHRRAINRYDQYAFNIHRYTVHNQCAVISICFPRPFRSLLAFYSVSSILGRPNIRIIRNNKHTHTRRLTITEPRNAAISSSLPLALTHSHPYTTLTKRSLSHIIRCCSLLVLFGCIWCQSVCRYVATLLRPFFTMYFHCTLYYVCICMECLYVIV